MKVYYNDIEPYCCAVLQKNIERGLLPGGYVDGRDIREVRAEQLVGYQHVHLFAGIGGFPFGFQWANFPEHISVITGGFPCQDISPAGSGNGTREGLDGARSGLWGDMFRLIGDIRPQYVIVENSSALLYRGASRVLGNLAGIGYDAQWQVLSAAAFGAPHLRERLYIVAYPHSNRSQTLWKKPTLLREETRHNIRPSHRDSVTSWRKNTDGLLWQSEPQVDRVADGIPTRLHELKGLGNAVVPQIPAYIARCIVSYEQNKASADIENGVEVLA